MPQMESALFCLFLFAFYSSNVFHVLQSINLLPFCGKQKDTDWNMIFSISNEIDNIQLVIV
jgi:hypothetical protein